MPFEKGRDYGLTLEEFEEWKRLSDSYHSLFREWSAYEYEGKGDPFGNIKWRLENACLWLDEFESKHGIEDEICPEEY